MKNTNEPEYLDPRPGRILLTNAEADELRAELDAVMKELKAADQAGTFLSPTARMRLEARRDDLKRQLADAERRPTGPSATPASNVEGKEGMALNDETLDAALRSMTPAERKEFGSEVSKALRAAKKLAADLGRPDLAGTAVNVSGGDEGDAFLDPKPYWSDDR